MLKQGRQYIYPSFLTLPLFAMKAGRKVEGFYKEKTGTHQPGRKWRGEGKGKEGEGRKGKEEGGRR